MMQKEFWDYRINYEEKRIIVVKIDKRDKVYD